MLGALSSGMLLYGASLVYGFTGTVSFPAIAAAAQGDVGLGLILGLVFVSAGVAFKISAVPFHMWTPDVYEGSPTPVTAFFAAAPKMAAMAMAVRVFAGAFPGILGQWQQIIIFISIASMALGSFAAIGQRNIKRLMAYSSIANVGYALLGLAAGTVQGVQGVAIYMAIYLAMTLGAFACILAMRRQNLMYENVEDLSGLARTHPVIAFCFAAMLFSLAGIPPLAGFFAKLYVFAAAIEAGLFVLVVIAAVTTRDRRVLLHPHRQGHVFRRAGRRLRADAPESQAGARADHRFGAAVLPSRHPVMDRRRGRRRRPVAVLTCVSRPKLTPPAIGCSPATRRSPPTTTPLLRRGTAMQAGYGSSPASSGRGGDVTAGHGSSPRGNLYASLLLVDPCEPAVAPQLGFIAGLALHEAVAAETGLAPPRLALKWPNDLLLDGAKTAGLLLEGHRAPRRRLRGGDRLRRQCRGRAQ